MWSEKDEQEMRQAIVESAAFMGKYGKGSAPAKSRIVEKLQDYAIASEANLCPPEESVCPQDSDRYVEDGRRAGEVSQKEACAMLGINHYQFCKFRDDMKIAHRESHLSRMGNFYYYDADLLRSEYEKYIKNKKLLKNNKNR